MQVMDLAKSFKSLPPPTRAADDIAKHASERAELAIFDAMGLIETPTDVLHLTLRVMVGMLARTAASYSVCATLDGDDSMTIEKANRIVLDHLYKTLQSELDKHGTPNRTLALIKRFRR